MSGSQEQYIIDPKGKKRAVILPIKQYEQMMEDLHDLAVVAERKNEEAIDIGEMKRRLKKLGLD